MTKQNRNIVENVITDLSRIYNCYILCEQQTEEDVITFQIKDRNSIYTNRVSFHRSDYFDVILAGEDPIICILDDLNKYLQNTIGVSKGIDRNSRTDHICSHCGAPLRKNQTVCDYCRCEIW